MRRILPFSAVVGQDDLKLALCLTAIDPLVGGVLVRGERGSGKTTLIRALGNILPLQRIVAGCPYRCDPDQPATMCESCGTRTRGRGPRIEIATERMRVVELPINATLERVVGGIDLEEALRRGAGRFSPGILAAANRNILYIDEVNLIHDAVVDALLDVAASGVNTVEREGISVSHPARFALIGSMNAQEGDLRPQLLDRFGLCVDVRALSDVETRADVAERDAALHTGRPAALAAFQQQDQVLARTISESREALPGTSLSREVLREICTTCRDNHVIGHRADVVMHHAVTALATLRGRTRGTSRDLADTAWLVLAHRARSSVNAPGRLPEDGAGDTPRPDAEDNQGPPPPTPNVEMHQPKTPSRTPRENAESTEPDEDPPDADPTDPEAPDPEGGSAGGQGEADESGAVPTATVAASALVPDVPLVELPRTRRPRARSGRRMRSRATDSRGRYVSARQQDPVTDIAVDATLRAAAPFQRARGWRPGTPLQLRRTDLRQKVREHKVGSLTIFVIDGSASMAAEQRMAITKSVILSLLRDAYVRRDKVAAIVFRGLGANVVLEPTSSVSVAERQLADLAVGGSTPLTHGLYAAHQLARREVRLDPSVRPLIVLVTDGHGNVAMGEGKPKAEAIEVATRIGAERIDALVIDTSPKADRSARVPMYHDLRTGGCRELSAAMAAEYFSMSAMDAGQLGRVVVRMRAHR